MLRKHVLHQPVLQSKLTYTREYSAYATVWWGCLSEGSHDFDLTFDSNTKFIPIPQNF